MTSSHPVQRMRFVACSAVLVAIAFIQAPGRIVADTKIDLVVAPGRFLARAAHLWDPVGAFGQVQNQAYGYFLPMGPFFWLGNVAGIEPWVVQRLWWALLLVVAFAGFVKLSELLGIGSPAVRLIGGFAYALSPRMISVIGPASIEVWPSALAPWVIVPLVVGATRRPPAAMAALSALAVAAVGGVNAVATFAVIPLAALWLLLSPPGRRRRIMMLTWPGFVLLGTAWWLGPLFVLGRWSPPFLDFIESASLTSFSTTLLDGLRGTSNWTAYLSETSVAGRAMITEQVIILNLAAILTLSVIGLCRRDLPHRLFLAAGVLLGLVLVTLGHTDALGGLAAGSLQDLLDGALAPLRNTHKFDLLIRLPMVLAFTHLLTVAAASAVSEVDGQRRWTPSAGVVVLAVAALAGSTAPAWSGQLAPRDSFQSVPQYWEEAAEWLSLNAEDDRALVVPASAFGTYLWGTTNDDPLQALATSPWGVRNAIPLAPPGNIQALDAISRELNDGRGGTGLAAYLRTSGVGHLVVRNDLRMSGDGLDPEVLGTSVEALPGATRVASFGPVTGGEPVINDEDGEGRAFIDQGWQSERRAVEIYRLSTTPQARTMPWGSVPTLVGAATSQIGLLESGLLRSPAVVMAEDLRPGDEPLPYLLTDGARRQEVAFGRVHDNRSATLERDEDFVADRRLHDYAVTDDDRWLSVRDLIGARSITASSSRAMVSSSGRIDPSAQAWSAFDGDPTTAWRAAPDDIGRRSWLRIELDEPADLSRLRVEIEGDPLTSTPLTVRTPFERVTVRARRGVPERIEGLTRASSSLEISGPSTRETQLAIRDVTLPGSDLSRPLRLPEVPSAWGAPAAIMLESSGGYRGGCLDVDDYLRCAAGQDGWGEDGQILDRIVTLPEEASYPFSLLVEPVGGDTLDDLLQADRLVRIEGSSQVTWSARASALNAADGDTRTAWLADPDDERPRLSLDWVEEQEVSTLRAFVDPLTAASPPTAVELSFSDGSRQSVELDDEGRGEFEPVEADGVEIEFVDSEATSSLGTDGTARRLPVGVSELRFGDEGLLPIGLGETLRLPCGSGPTIEVDERQVETRIAVPTESVRDGERFMAVPCGDVDELELPAGQSRIRVNSQGAFRPVRLALGDEAQAGTSVRASVGPWGPRDRAVTLERQGERLLNITENTNLGWRASEGDPIVVNGWQQGWTVDADRVELEFVPDRLYRTSLVLGLMLLLSLLMLPTILQRGRSEDAPEASPRARSPRLTTAMVVVSAGGGALVLGGPLGLVAAVVGAAVAAASTKRFESSVVAAALVGITAAASAARPWGGASAWFGSFAWPQMVMLGALGAVAFSLLGRPRRRNRPLGRSTHR